MARCLEQGRPGTVYGDCQYVINKCQRIQQGHEIPDGENADLWQRVRARLRHTQGWDFRWIPSHKTEAEAQACGVPRLAWAMNAAADRKAKEAAQAASPPQEILAKHWRHVEAEQAMQRIIAKAQVTHLAERARRKGTEVAVKARKRKAPKGPEGPARKRPAKATNGDEDRQVLIEQWRVRPSRRWPGAHHLVLVQQCRPERGQIPKRPGGAIKMTFECARCGKRADDTSRALALMRKKCQAQCNFQQGKHEVQVEGRRERCRWCGTERPQCERLARKNCPVFQCQDLHGPRQEGTLEYQALHKVIRALQELAKPVQPTLREEAQQESNAAPAQADQAPRVKEARRPAEEGGPRLRARYQQHKVWTVVGAGFCEECLERKPRYRQAEWAASPCDGRAPVEQLPWLTSQALWVAKLQARNGRQQDLVAKAQQRHEVPQGEANNCTRKCGFLRRTANGSRRCTVAPGRQGGLAEEGSANQVPVGGQASAIATRSVLSMLRQERHGKAEERQAQEARQSRAGTQAANSPRAGAVRGGPPFPP